MATSRRRSRPSVRCGSRSTSGAIGRGSCRRSPGPSPRGTATSPRRRSRSPTIVAGSTTSWSRSPTSVSSRRSCRPSAKCPTSSTSSAFAASSSRRGHARPLTVVTRRQFEVLVDKALRKLPKTFRQRISNIAVVVEDWADAETLAEMGIEPPDTLYGLYRGIDLTRRDSSYGNVMPDVNTIYQGSIEEDAVDEQEMAEIVRETVVHELGHYFGLDDEMMHRIEDGED